MEIWSSSGKSTPIDHPVPNLVLKTHIEVALCKPNRLYLGKHIYALNIALLTDLEEGNRKENCYDLQNKNNTEDV